MHSQLNLALGTARTYWVAHKHIYQIRIHRKKKTADHNLIGKVVWNTNVDLVFYYKKFEFIITAMHISRSELKVMNPHHGSFSWIKIHFKSMFTIIILLMHMRHNFILQSICIVKYRIVKSYLMPNISIYLD